MRQIARAIVIRGEQLLVMKRDKHGEKFFALPGGDIESGETPEQATVRETLEETSIEVKVVREIYREEVEEFGETSYFICSYVSGEPKLDPNAIEVKLSAEGNVYQPMWLEIRALEDTVFLPRTIAHKLEQDLELGFAKQVTVIKGQKENL